jgi:hypothetical protein
MGESYLVGEVYSHGKDADIIWLRKGHDVNNIDVCCSVEEISRLDVVLPADQRKIGAKIYPSRDFLVFTPKLNQVAN